MAVAAPARASVMISVSQVDARDCTVTSKERFA
jgi:hypothetical protein